MDAHDKTAHTRRMSAAIQFSLIMLQFYQKPPTLSRKKITACTAGWFATAPVHRLKSDGTSNRENWFATEWDPTHSYSNTPVPPTGPCCCVAAGTPPPLANRLANRVSSRVPRGGGGSAFRRNEKPRQEGWPPAGAGSYLESATNRHESKPPSQTTPLSIQSNQS